MALNPSIILAGDKPDIMGRMYRANEQAAAQGERNKLNALNSFMQAAGDKVAAGDQNALNRLAMFDPSAALGIQQTRQGMAHADELLSMDRERLQVVKQQAAQQARALAAKASAAEVEAEKAELKSTMEALTQAQTPEEWNGFLARKGYDPAEYPWEQRAMLLAGTLGAVEALEAVKVGDDVPGGAGGKMPASVQEYEFARAQGFPGTFLDFQNAKKGNGFSVDLPDGTRVQMGGAQGEAKIPASSPDYMLETINGILSDPALDSSTGVFSALQNIPGTPQKRFGTRARQLEGQAFLQAFESLKGGGQITEIEGQKATQAIGRLDTAQSADDYREALTDLKEVLEAAKARAGQQPLKAPGADLSTAPAGIDPEDWKFMPEDLKKLWVE